MRLLIIEDDREAAAYVVKAFRETGHSADSAHDGLDGYALACEGAYDVLIVDRMLPKLDGLSLIRSLREQKIATPALILSALGQVDDRVKGLRAGGDDYLPKPYAFSELLARTEALARRQSGSGNVAETRYRVGDLELDRLSRRVTRAGREVPLQPRELRLRHRLQVGVGDLRRVRVLRTVRRLLALGTALAARAGSGGRHDLAPSQIAKPTMPIRPTRKAMRPSETGPMPPRGLPPGLLLSSPTDLT